MSRQTQYTERKIEASELERITYLLREGHSQKFVAKRFELPLRHVRYIAIERGLIRKGRPAKERP